MTKQKPNPQDLLPHHKHDPNSSPPITNNPLNDHKYPPTSTRQNTPITPTCPPSSPQNLDPHRLSPTTRHLRHHHIKPSPSPAGRLILGRRGLRRHLVQAVFARLQPRDLSAWPCGGQTKQKKQLSYRTSRALACRNGRTRAETLQNFL